MLRIYLSTPDLRPLCKSASNDELSYFSKRSQTSFTLSRSASGPGTPWVEGLLTLKNYSCFQRFYSRRPRAWGAFTYAETEREVPAKCGSQRFEYIPMYHILNICAGAGGNGNGFNMNQKLIYELFPPPAPRSHANTNQFSLFSTPLLSRRTRPLSPD